MEATDGPATDAMERSSAAPEALPDRPRLVSVVIPMYNAGDVIGDQLEALARQDYDGAWEVVVADNGSDDHGVEVVERYDARLPSLRVVDASDKQGASCARNVGSRAARGDVLLYADADDMVPPDWVRALAGGLASADFVGGWRTDDHLRATDVASTSSTLATLPTSFGFLPWAFGGNLGVRTAVFHEVGGWCEDYPHGGDDIDFCWRVQLAGHPLLYVAEAAVRYRARETLGGLARQRFEFGSRAPMLFREYQRFGAKRPPLRRAASTWFWVLTRVPYLLASRRLRRRWVATASGAAGRLWGSYRCRTACL